MKLPILIINFKTYETAVGDKALELARTIKKVADDTGVNFAVAAAATDLKELSDIGVPILAQHVDPCSFGSNTGHILPEMVKDKGAIGTLLNHSENRLDPEQIKESIRRCKETGIETIVCAQDAAEGKKLAEFGPDMIAVEPPELIGKMSVSKARPEVISESVGMIHGTVLVGAGVVDAGDVRKAIELGAKGCLLASGVTKAQDPEKVLRDLASGI